jgi:hypothetical protein
MDVTNTLAGIIARWVVVGGDKYAYIADGTDNHAQYQIKYA